MSDCRLGVLDWYHMERYCHEHAGFAYAYGPGPQLRCDRAPKPELCATGEPRPGGEPR